jgi:tetratricopeptide (TPR) repeat protein
MCHWAEKLDLFRAEMQQMLVRASRFFDEEDLYAAYAELGQVEQTFQKYRNLVDQLPANYAHRARELVVLEQLRGSLYYNTSCVCALLHRWEEAFSLAQLLVRDYPDWYVSVDLWKVSFDKQ